MPALYLFHRRTILGGDDLQPAAFFTATLRVVQLFFLLLPILFHVIHEIIAMNKYSQQQDSTLDDDDFNNDNNDSNSTNSSCHYSSRQGLLKYNYYYLGILLLYAVLSTIYNILTLCFLERPLSYWSSIGSPTETHIRSPKVARLLEFKLLHASMLLFVLWIIGVMATALAPHYYRCQGVLITQQSRQSQSSSTIQSSNRLLEDANFYNENDDDTNSQSNYRSHRYYWTMLAPTIILLATQLAEVIVSWTYLISLCAQPREDNVDAFVPLQQDSVDDADAPHHHVPMHYHYEEDVHGDGRPGLHPHSRAQQPSSSSSTDSLPPPITNQNHELVEEMWAERCASLCQCLGMASCFCFGGHEIFHHYRGAHTTTGAGTGLIGHSDFGEIARALADYLETRGVLDIVPSDIVTGFLVLQQLQKQRILAARRAVLNDLSSQEEGFGLMTGGGGATTSHRQNSLLLGCGSNISICSNDGTHQHHTVSGSAAASAVAPMMGINAAAAAEMNNNEEDSSLFVPLDSPPASSSLANNNNCYQRSSQKSTTGNGNGNGSSTAPTTMAYHLSALSSSSTTPRTPTTGAADHNVSGSGNGGCYYQALSSPTTSAVAAPGVDASTAAEQRCRSSAAVRILLQRNNFADMMALEEGARYAKYALAIYTWVLYLYVNPITGVFRLAGHAACSACSTSSSSSASNSSSNDTSSPRDPRTVTNTIDENGHIEGDNLCHTHRSALLLAAGGLSSTDLVYAQLKSRFNQNPYCILLDHEWRNVVVSIRGTFSLEDCITDVLIEPESLEKLGHDFGFDAMNQYCHGGVFACARNIYRDLERHGLLDQLLLPSGGVGGAAPARYPDYNLRLVGHSLGSATCTLLSFMLRPKFPNLKVINYCPVGCCLTWEMATACHDWCTSFVLDSDIVARLSVDSMEVLRDEILDLIARIKVNKVEVAKRLVGGGGGAEFDDDGNDNNNDPNGSIRVEDLLYPPDQVPDTDYTRRLVQFKAIQEERRSTRALRVVKLYPPGKIVHLVKTGEQRACIHGIAKCLTCCTTNVGFVYTPVWINNDDLDEIVVNPHMGTDHFPNRIASVLANVAMEFGLQT